MKCPVCGNDCRKGFVEASDAGSITQSLTMLNWFPEEYKGKIFRKGAVRLGLKGEGYYCEECMMVFASFQER